MTYVWSFLPLSCCFTLDRGVASNGSDGVRDAQRLERFLAVLHCSGRVGSCGLRPSEAYQSESFASCAAEQGGRGFQRFVL